MHDSRDTQERGRHRAAGLPRHRAPRVPVIDRVGNSGRSVVMTAALIAGVGVAGLSAATAGAHPSSPIDPNRAALDAQAGVQSPVGLGLPYDDVTDDTTDVSPTATPTPSETATRIAAERIAKAAAPVRVTTSPIPKPVWVNPLPEAHVSSCYGERWGRLHAGVDLAAPNGTPIVAAGAGTVVSAGADYGGYGISVLIDHHNGYLTHYAHMSATVVQPGDQVQPGQHIGNEGSTGHSTGPHLHFEVHQGVWKNTIEPTTWMHEHGVDIPGCAVLTPVKTTTARR